MTISLQFAIIFAFIVAPAWLSSFMSNFFGLKLHTNLSSFLTREIPVIFFIYCLIPLVLSIIISSCVFEIGALSPIAYLVGNRDPKNIVNIAKAASNWTYFFVIYFVLVFIFSWIISCLFKNKKWFQKILESCGIWQPFIQKIQDEMRAYNAVQEEIEKSQKEKSQKQPILEKYCEVDLSCESDGSTIYSGTLVGISDVGNFQGILLRHVTIKSIKALEHKLHESELVEISHKKTERYPDSKPGVQAIEKDSNAPLDTMFFPKEKITFLHFRSGRAKTINPTQASVSDVLRKIDNYSNNTQEGN